MGNVFNFDLVRSFTANIAEICDYAMDKMERNKPKNEEGFFEF